MTIATDTLTNFDGSLSVPTETVVKGSAKAWVNFNGTGTVAIRASFNVSSITDHAVGEYTANYTTALPSANYPFTGCIKGTAGLFCSTSLAASSARMTTRNSTNAAAFDADEVFAVVHSN